MLIASGVAFVALFAMGLIVFVQFSLTSAGGQAIQEALSPASDSSASLSLAQANASGALSDFIMLERARSLTEYRDSIATAGSLLDQLGETIPDDEIELEALLATARSTQETWIASDSEPSVVAMLSGQQARAVRITNARAAWTSYDAMTEASNALAKAVNRARDEASDVVNGFTVFLGVTLLVVGILITAGLVAFLMGIQHWVLAPLRHIRKNLQQAAREVGHETPIEPVGPPELRDVAVDGEHLRRSLVSEIDDARAAREGLAQDAPLVAAMQAELVAPAVDVPGITVAGVSQSAEGVMAGDWWDQILRPDGTLALVVADVSGHGPEASVTAIRVRSVLRSGLERGLPLEEIVEMAAASCANDAHFVTGIVLVIDPVGGTVSWLNAGHHPAILVTHDKDASLCEPTGPLISSLGGTWTVRSRYFRPGDVLVAFTDGLVESRNADGDELESSMVSQFIRGLDSWVRESPDELITRLLAQVRHRASDWRRDDVTLVAAARPR
jgi:sigma-B regulation protein RsbU (phosphoserine phosphatase)